MNKHTILCFGDSNTWGYDPSSDSRHSFDTRWTGVLQESLSNSCRIIEAGLNGRTTVFEEPFRPDRDGSRSIGTLLESHTPLDLVIVALGANDLKPIYSASGYDSALGLARVIEIILSSSSGHDGGKPRVLVLPPVRFGTLSQQTGTRFKGGAEKFPELLGEYRLAAATLGVNYLDPNDIIVTSTEDGVHLDPENHVKLGKTVGEYVGKLLDVEHSNQ